MRRRTTIWMIWLTRSTSWISKLCQGGWWHSFHSLYPSHRRWSPVTRFKVSQYQCRRHDRFKPWTRVHGYRPSISRKCRRHDRNQYDQHMSSRWDFRSASLAATGSRPWLKPFVASRLWKCIALRRTFWICAKRRPGANRYSGGCKSLAVADGPSTMCPNTS